MSQNAATPPGSGWALFLDVDGTLLQNAETTPQGVQVPGSHKDLLSSLCMRLDGALALLSGSRIADLDALFAPYRFCIAGVHGCETRDAAGCLLKPPSIDTKAFEVARNLLLQLIERHPQLQLEDRRFGLTLHFERAPHLRVLARTAMKSVVDVLGPAFRLQAGRFVFEVHPSAWSKASAVAGFMLQSPFRGRTPVLVGDDFTDQDAFVFVNAHDGVSVRVGARSPTTARYSLTQLADAIEWLATIPPVMPPKCSHSEAHDRPWT